ncbi:glycoside hydrolase family 25 protein [Neoconidiobolus thromboides FSU 785]|nr:glycoside hydrolase family 25 protein [Neoconidiobolus thromboides FSU 785]
MKLFIVTIFAGIALAAGPKGIDVSGWQPNVNWNTVKANGVEFVYIKATESTNYKSPQFNSQYTGATNVGLIRGAYHFARPGSSSGAAQANYFVANGGGWSGDGRTLPGALDLEAGCSGLSQAAMVNWIRDFSNTYHAKTSRYPVIYTTTSWWQQCTGNNASFGNTNPLWIARWASSPGALPAGWSFHTFWQYADSGPNPGDQDYFNGSSANLKKFASV